MALKEPVSPSVGVQGAPLRLYLLLDLNDDTGAIITISNQEIAHVQEPHFTASLPGYLQGVH